MRFRSVKRRVGNDACRRIATGNRTWSHYLGLASQANAFRRSATGNGYRRIAIGKCNSSLRDYGLRFLAL